MCKKHILWAVVIVGVYVVLEGLILGTLYLLQGYSIQYEPRPLEISKAERGSIHYILDRHTFDPYLGWVLEKDDALYTGVGAQGIRNNRIYSAKPEEDVKRIVVMGDSFAYGSEVALEDTWTQLLENDSLNTEVLNFGVSAYGLDQSYLRYVSEAKNFHPDTVIVVHNSYQTLRLLTVYYAFRDHSNYARVKPRFLLKQDELRLQQQPFKHEDDYNHLLHDTANTLKLLGKYDGVYQSRYYAGPLDVLPSVRLVKVLYHHWFRSSTSYDAIRSPDNEMNKIAFRLMHKYKKAVTDNGSTILIGLFPTNQDIANALEGEDPSYAVMRNFLEKEEIDYVDLMAPLLAYAKTQESVNNLFMEGGHYAPEVNRIVANYIKKFL